MYIIAEIVAAIAAAGVLEGASLHVLCVPLNRAGLTPDRIAVSPCVAPIFPPLSHPVRSARVPASRKACSLRWFVCGPSYGADVGQFITAALCFVVLMLVRSRQHDSTDAPGRREEPARQGSGFCRADLCAGQLRWRRSHVQPPGAPLTHSGHRINALRLPLVRCHLHRRRHEQRARLWAQRRLRLFHRCAVRPT